MKVLRLFLRDVGNFNNPYEKITKDLRKTNISLCSDLYFPQYAVDFDNTPFSNLSGLQFEYIEQSQEHLQMEIVLFSMGDAMIDYEWATYKHHLRGVDFEYLFT